MAVFYLFGSVQFRIVCTKLWVCDLGPDELDMKLSLTEYTYDLLPVVVL